MEKYKVYIFFLFSLFVIIVSWPFLSKEIKLFYIFKIDGSGKLKGTIITSNEQSSWDGVSYECQIEYTHKNAKYRFTENLPDNIQGKILPGDTLNVVYSIRDPSEATANASFNLVFYLIGGIIVMAFFIGSLIKVIYTLKKGQ
jgi:hypothetical protein